MAEMFYPPLLIWVATEESTQQGICLPWVSLAFSHSLEKSYAAFWSHPSLPERTNCKAVGIPLLGLADWRHSDHLLGHAMHQISKAA